MGHDTSTSGKEQFDQLILMLLSKNSASGLFAALALAVGRFNLSTLAYTVDHIQND
jgi:hypothetical protein